MMKLIITAYVWKNKGSWIKKNKHYAFASRRRVDGGKKVESQTLLREIVFIFIFPLASVDLGTYPYLIHASRKMRSAWEECLIPIRVRLQTTSKEFRKAPCHPTPLTFHLSTRKEASRNATGLAPRPLTRTGKCSRTQLSQLSRTILSRGAARCCEIRLCIFLE